MRHCLDLSKMGKNNLSLTVNAVSSHALLKQNIASVLISKEAIMKRSILLSLLGITLMALSVYGQEPSPSPAETPRIVGEVTVTSKNANMDPIYRELRGTIGQRAFSSEYVSVNNLVLKKDRATFTFTSGEIYFLTPLHGRNVGAVFIGEGEITLTPPNDTEKKSLAIFTDSPDLKEQFTQLVMMFTDKTADEIKNSPNVKMASDGANAARAQDAYKEKETLLKKTFHYNISSRMLADIYSPDRPGFFYSFIDGKKFGKLSFQLDPLGIPEVYPEQVELSSYAESTGGVLTAFHLEDEYKKGTANSWTDRRLYDISKHDLDVTIQGTRITAKDVITMQTRYANVRYIPFDLYRSLRVKSVRTEDNSEIDFIQEKKDEDADFGIILPAAPEAGKTFQVTVEYDGAEALQLAGKGNFFLGPRSTWYPNNPGTAFGDRAKFDITFRYPKKFTMIGVGDRVGEEAVEGDQKISKWTSGDTEMAVAGFNYGDFKEQQLADPDTGYNLEVYTNEQLPQRMRDAQLSNQEQGEMTGRTIDAMNTTSGAKVVLAQAQNATRIYNSFFGKMPYKRLAMSQQPAGGFGQAWPTLVFMPYIAFVDSTLRTQLMGIRGGTSDFWDNVAAHEVAHQWWGHMVGWTSYHDQWMSEGFAEFSSSLYVIYVEKDVNKFNAFWEAQRKLITEASPSTLGKRPYSVGPVTQGYRLNTAKTGNIARRMIYPKGAYILHMIRMMMFDHKGGTGDDKFKAMMNDFLKSHANQDVSTEDFKHAVEKYITKEMDVDKNGKMDWFFDSWVYGSQVPEFNVSYKVGNGANGKLTFSAKITQSGVSDDFVSIVPLYMDFGAGWRFVGRATLVGNSTFDIPDFGIPSAPKKVTIDAYKDVLNTSITMNK
jgi:hypothetical protein